MSAREYLTLLREQGWAILLCLVLGLGGAALLSAVIPPTYASQTSYYVASASSAADVTATDNYSGAQLSAERVKSYVELIRSPRVAVDASALLGAGTTPTQIQDAVTTDTVTETVILNATVTGPTPQEATRRATAVTQAFTSLVGRLETSRGPGSPPSVAVQIVLPPSAGVVVAPRPSLYLLVGAIVGIVLGFGVAVARRSLVQSVSRPRDLEDITRAPVLTAVPFDRRTKDTPDAHAPTTDSVASRSDRRRRSRSEAYQRARTHLEFANINGDRRLLLVTSALHDEGKTTTVANLATALGAVGHRVLVVEADLRRPSLVGLLGLEPSPGLCSLLLKRSYLPDVLRRWGETVHVLPAGDTPPRPNDLLASAHLGALMRQLAGRYDYVLIDTPPVLPVADAATVGRHADGAILVCRRARTSREEIRAACAALRSVAVPVVGSVLSHSAAPPSIKAVRSARGAADASRKTPAAGTWDMGSWSRRIGGADTGVAPATDTPATAGVLTTDAADGTKGSGDEAVIPRHEGTTPTERSNPEAGEDSPEDEYSTATPPREEAAPGSRPQSGETAVLVGAPEDDAAPPDQNGHRTT